MHCLLQLCTQSKYSGSEFLKNVFSERAWKPLEDRADSGAGWSIFSFLWRNPLNQTEPLEPYSRYSITLHTRPNKVTCNMKRINNSESTYGSTQFYFIEGCKSLHLFDAAHTVGPCPHRFLKCVLPINQLNSWRNNVAVTHGRRLGPLWEINKPILTLNWLNLT